ncbi:MAG: hydroxyisourate hydrolase [Novosphingobium sp. 17-62-19]|uniref:hydroxyisourate hydrolase n=1 Tax=Novosphingobium sp. 17-62-19 TaxID=1970406 RepID=UPI000BD07B7E|nr:hydroxyisourate hydrolase [Novosphingobium sp. 17-62-19]OYX94482.1 MAG: hydroxyisourate hydrolase [Novosphingobium sp. 35-62-5]OZA17929.1 MAG: hydroxyisourate hydrolase [Novosphingobium sp. 17-62-19]
MKMLSSLFLISSGLVAVPVTAAEISTHVLDLANGVGGADVPVTLSQRDAAGKWIVVGAARTDAKGRVRGFGPGGDFAPGTYRLHFDMAAYPDSKAKPFFPEITVTFNVTDRNGHYHVPVVVSPYGYSSYRGN